MTIEEIANMTWDERHDYFQKCKDGTEEFVNPIENMTSEEAEAYFESIGAVSWDKFSKSLMDRMFDAAEHRLGQQGRDVSENLSKEFDSDKELLDYYHKFGSVTHKEMMDEISSKIYFPENDERFGGISNVKSGKRVTSDMSDIAQRRMRQYENERHYEEPTGTNDK